MELKHGTKMCTFYKTEGLNRTTMELKPFFSMAETNLRFGLNRTTMELKRRAVKKRRTA